MQGNTYRPCMRYHKISSMNTYTTPGFDKDFYQSYSSLVPTLRISGVLAQVISALTEYGVIYTMIAHSVEALFRNQVQLIAHLGALTGTIFIEVGLRKFLPYSFRAILYKRYQGLHLVLSILIFSAAALLLTASGTLSYYGSHSIVRHFTPPPNENSEKPFMQQREDAELKVDQRWALDSSLVQQRYVKVREQVEAQYHQSAVALIGKPGYLRLQARKATELAKLEQERVQQLNTALRHRDHELESIANRYDAKIKNLEDSNAIARTTAQKQVYRQGTNLGLFTIMCLLLLIFCIGIEETHKKGAGIAEVAPMPIGRNTPGLWTMFWRSAWRSWETRMQQWITHRFPQQIESAVVSTANTIDCAHCGKPYTPNRRSQRFCQKSCRLGYHAAKYNGKKFFPVAYKKVANNGSLNGAR